MPIFKNKFFLPLCAAGLFIGYAGSEWVAPRYFHPTSETRITAQSLITAIGVLPEYYHQTASGNYLSGHFAQRHKDWKQATRFITNVLDTDATNQSLQKHVMVLAMTSGDVNHAVKLAKEIIKEDQANILATLFLASNEFKNKNYSGAIAILEAVGNDNPAGFIVPVLKLWAQSEKGSIDVSALEQHSFYAYHALLAGNHTNDSKDAVKYALKAYSNDEIDIRDIEKIADLFAHMGQEEKAKTLYTSIKKQGFSSVELEEKISLLESKKSIADKIKIQPVTSPEEGAAVVFHDMAEMLLREYSDDSATIFAQMSLHLNPELEENHMIIGNILSRHERYDDAIAHYHGIKENSDLYVTAQRRIADLYAEQKKHDAAIKILSDVYKTHGNVEALIQIGDIYRYQEDHKNAVKSYNKVLNTKDNVAEEYWHVLYARGMSYERLKKFKKSENDLKSALEFRPDHPYILNYLGYSWADQGINLQQSLDMIKQAVRAKPDDGYIADSLGWVYYKMDDFTNALPHMERAVELQPYDATINDHLGDIYWLVGRKLEARFQWRRAVNYSDDNEAELKEEIKQKIITGLPERPKKKTKKITEKMEKIRQQQSSL